MSLFAAITSFQIQNSLHAMVKQFIFTAVGTTVGRINVVFSSVLLKDAVSWCNYIDSAKVNECLPLME